jgi:hypothetical protein
MPGAPDADAQRGVAQQIDAAHVGSLSSDKGAIVTTSERFVPDAALLAAAALLAPAEHSVAKGAVPSLITPAKEAAVPVGAARPFSADTA